MAVVGLGGLGHMAVKLAKSMGAHVTVLSTSPDKEADAHRRMGSMIGGIAETQEMLDPCAAHGIVSDIEIIPIQAINEAYDRVLASYVRYRFAIDMASLRAG